MSVEKKMDNQCGKPKARDTRRYDPRPEDEYESGYEQNGRNGEEKIQNSPSSTKVHGDSS